MSAGGHIGFMEIKKMVHIGFMQIKRGAQGQPSWNSSRTPKGYESAKNLIGMNISRSQKFQIDYIIHTLAETTSEAYLHALLSLSLTFLSTNLIVPSMTWQWLAAVRQQCARVTITTAAMCSRCGQHDTLLIVTGYLTIITKVLVECIIVECIIEPV